MKYLTERTEIAKVMNFGKYPVLSINMENNKGFGPEFAEGCDVKVEHNSKTHGVMNVRGYLCYCNGKMEICCGGFGIHSGFGRSDVQEMVKWANAPTVKASQEVVVVMDYPSKKCCSVAIYKISEKVNQFCQTVVTLS